MCGLECRAPITHKAKTVLPPCQRQHGKLEVGSDNGTLLPISPRMREGGNLAILTDSTDNIPKIAVAVSGLLAS